MIRIMWQVTVLSLASTHGRHRTGFKTNCQRDSGRLLCHIAPNSPVVHKPLLCWSRGMGLFLYGYVRQCRANMDDACKIVNMIPSVQCLKAANKDTTQALGVGEIVHKHLTTRYSMLAVPMWKALSLTTITSNRSPYSPLSDKTVQP